jgi:hypothetical protein
MAKLPMARLWGCGLGRKRRREREAEPASAERREKEIDEGRERGDFVSADVRIPLDFY